jgi:hypothetical protein
VGGREELFERECGSDPDFSVCDDCTLVCTLNNVLTYSSAIVTSEAVCPSCSSPTDMVGFSSRTLATPSVLSRTERLAEIESLSTSASTAHSLLVDRGTLHQRGGMERRLIRRSPWGSVLSQQQNCKDDEDHDAQGYHQQGHPPPRLWIACDHDEMLKAQPEGRVLFACSDRLSFVESMRNLASGLARTKTLMTRSQGIGLKTPS